MTEPTTSAPDVPNPRAYTLTVPDAALAVIGDLHRVRQLHVAAFLTTAARTLRTRPAAPMDGCLNRGTCRPATTDPCCLLCALDAAVIRHLPDDANTAAACDLVQAGTVAKQLAIDTIEANPRHGGEVFVLNHLADMIRIEEFEARTARSFDPPTTVETS